MVMLVLVLRVRCSTPARNLDWTEVFYILFITITEVLCIT